LFRSGLHLRVRIGPFPDRPCREGSPAPRQDPAWRALHFHGCWCLLTGSKRQNQTRPSSRGFVQIAMWNCKVSGQFVCRPRSSFVQKAGMLYARRRTARSRASTVRVTARQKKVRASEAGVKQRRISPFLHSVHVTASQVLPSPLPRRSPVYPGAECGGRPEQCGSGGAAEVSHHR
jgi:hypothetical protein